MGVLTNDSFTQANPPNFVVNVSTRVDTTRTGVLSGSVAVARPDIAASNHIGGPGALVLGAAWAGITAIGYHALGIFINSANGNPYENTPGVASGVGPYVSGMGTYGDALYETIILGNAAGGTPAITNPITWYTGQRLVASVNGYLYPQTGVSGAGTVVSCDQITATAESLVLGVADSSTVLGVIKMTPDAVQTEIVFDARV